MRAHVDSQAAATKARERELYLKVRCAGVLV
jgi:hypothetical protein